MRRATFQSGTVDYAAVGATQAADLLGYPPERSIPAEESWLIGSGEERFRSSGEALLSWGAQRGARLTLSDITPAPAPGYSGVSFDADGQAVAPSSIEVDQRFDADGTPYVSAGMTLSVRGRAGGLRADSHARVISVAEEPRRIGFLLGTVGGSVVSGEESFMVEWRDNDEVWFTVRAFDRPTAATYRVLRALVRRRRRALFQAYLTAISPLFRTR